MFKPKTGNTSYIGRRLLSILGIFAFVLVSVASSFAVYTYTRGGEHAYAATSSTLNFQARLANVNGSSVPDGYYNIRFKIYDGGTQGGPSGTGQANSGTGGTYLWTEEYYDANGVTAGQDNRVRVVNGYFSVNLGSQTAFPSTIRWDQELWLTMDVGGTTQTATPTYDGEMTNANARTKLTAVPYAFSSAKALTLEKNTGSFTGTVDFSTMTADRKFLFPDTSLATTASPGTICVYNGAASNCPAASGSAYYIQNTGGSGTPQAAANFNIQATDSGVSGTVAGILRAAAGGQTVDLLQVQNSGGSVIAAITAAGNLQVASSVDVRSAGTLSIGNATATAISIGNTTSNILTIINGTTLVKPTTGNDSATAFQVQNAASIDVVTVDTTNSKLIVRSSSTDATLGSELITSQDFTNATYWTCSTGWTTTTTTAQHNTGNSNTCVATSSNVSVTSGTTYRITFRLAGNTTETDTITARIGGVSAAAIGQSGTNTQTVVITATSTGALTFTPTSNFNGTIDQISVKVVTLNNAALVVNNSSNATTLEIRASGSASQNVFIGSAAGQSNTSSGTFNTAVGYQALQSNLQGSSNTAFGRQALQNNTSGSSNLAVGVGALQLNSRGSNNVAVGNSALGNTTTGTNNSGFGNAALQANTTGTFNTGLGYFALQTNQTGSYNTGVGYSGLRANISGSQNTAIGYFAGYQDSGINFNTLSNLTGSTAIGAYAQVQASNTIVLGSVDNATQVVIGATVGQSTNTFGVSPLDYQTGTATRTNSSATLTGTGTTWTSAMVGDVIIFADGTTNTVSAFTDATHITMGTTYTGTTDASPVAYRFHKIGLQVANTGNVGIGTTAPTNLLSVVKNFNGLALITVGNTDTGTNAAAATQYSNSGTGTASVGLGGTNYSTVSVLQNRAFLVGSGATSGVVLGTTGAQPILFAVSSAEKARFDTSGNLLLGNTTGTSLLSVGSSAQLSVDTTGNLGTSGTITVTNATTDITTGSNQDLTVVANGTGVIDLNDTVKIGALGTTNTSTYICRNSSNQLAGCNTTGAGAAFVQGGNSFGAAADLGTIDNFDLTFRTNNSTKLTLTTAGDLQLAQGANRTLNVAANTTANGAGYNFTLAAGAANGSTTGNVGGVLALQGGAAAGSGNNNGGNVTIDGGAATGTGTKGTVALQNSGGVVSIGSLASQGASEMLGLGAATNAARYVGVHNGSTGGSATAGFSAYNDNAGGTTNNIYVGIASTGYSTAILQNRGFVLSGGGTAGLVVGTSGVTNPTIFVNNSAEIARFSSAGNLLLGNTTGTSLLSVGSSAQLTVDTSGNLATSGTLTVTNATTDITSSTNEDLTVVANGTGVIDLNDTVKIGTLGAADTDNLVCRNSSGQLATCSSGSLAGTAFIQGGNSFSAAGNLGTNDNFALNLRTNGTTKLTVTTTGDLQFAQGANRTLSVAQNASNASGYNMTITAGQGGAGNNNGGNLILSGGAATGSGAAGSVIVKPTANTTSALQVQTAGATPVLTVDTTNSQTILRGINSDATLGSEKVTNGTFTGSATGWTLGGGAAYGSNAIIVSAGSGGTISQDVSAVVGETYQVTFDVSGANGCYYLRVGGAPQVHFCEGSTGESAVFTATTTGDLEVITNGDFSGTFDNFSVKKITNTNPVLIVKNSDGSTGFELRSGGTQWGNMFVGLESGRSNTTGYANTVLGSYALQNNTEGGENTAVGTESLFNNTTGYDNTALGYDSLYHNTTGQSNVGIGSFALNNNSTGSENTALGASALTSLNSGSYNTGIGAYVFNNLGTGSGNTAVGEVALSSLAVGSYNTAFGFQAGWQDSGTHFNTGATISNSTAIGAYAQVQASNTIVLGSVDIATQVVIGATIGQGTNTFGVSPLDYQTGTVTRTNGSATLVGTGTTWANTMVGDLIIFADGTTNTVSAFTDATHITMGTTYTGTTDASPVYYRFHRPGFQVTNAGNTYIQNTSVTAFEVKNSAGTSTLSVNTSTNLVTINGDVTVAAQKTITLVGGTTAQRPASPTEGMLYFDSTTKQLLTYANGKWQGDRSTSTKIVAASNSSQAIKDSADYVATGTGDQATINTALTAASGGTVYLTEGTYTLSTNISVPSGTTLSGAGVNTLLTIPNSQNGTYAMIQTAAGSNARVSDLQIDCNKSGQTSGTMTGIYVNTDASSITNTTVQNCYDGIFVHSYNSVVTSNWVYTNDHVGVSVYYDDTAVANNTIQSNGIDIQSSGLYNRITGNDIGYNDTYGIYLDSASSENIVSANTIVGSGFTTTNNGIYVEGDYHNINGNYIYDYSCTTTCYAINIAGAGAAGTYLSNNTYTGTIPNPATINNAGTSTIYGGQVDGSTNYLIQPAGTIELMKNTNITGNLVASGDGTFNGGDLTVATSTATNDKIAISITTGGAAQFTGTITNADLTAARTWTLPNETGTFCMQGSTNCGFATSSGSGSYIQNQNASQQSSSNFWISGSGRADTSFLAPTFDTATAVSLTVGGTATAISLADDTTLAAGKYLRITGDVTASRPASPAEGMVFFDTTTKQLIVYANGKWQTQRPGTTKIVAASNASQALKDAADYVATGTGDQATINTALTAASGGIVYLTEGTYTIATAGITIPNNTTLAGAGAGTVITIPNAQNGTYNAITNTDTTTGTNVTIRDLQIDGNKANQTSGTMVGIYMNGMGGGSGNSARNGANITNVIVKNMRNGPGLKLNSANNNLITSNTISLNGDDGMDIFFSSYNTIAGNNVQGNTTDGLNLNTATNNTVSGNTFQGNGIRGIYLANADTNNTITGNTTNSNGTYGVMVASSSNGNTVTGNTAQGQTEGILVSASSNNTVSGNLVQSNTGDGIRLAASANLNTIAGNRVDDNGGATTNNGIQVDTSDNNLITGNNITDSSCTTTCYAINISNATADNTYISDNRLSTTSGTATINNAGTGTIYGGQVDGSTNFVIQPAGTIELMKNTNVTGTLTVSGNVTFTNGNLTTGTNTDLTVTANGSGVINLNDTVKVGTLGAVTANSAALCRDTSTNILTACDSSNTTGRAFLQGGNSFGVAGDLGTNDAFDLNLRTGGTTKLTLDNATGSLTFAQGANRTISVSANTTANGAGYNFTVGAGAANGSTTGNVGGVLALNGGAAAGSGNNNGGNVTIDGGAKTGTGTKGYVVLQGAGGNVGIGTTSPSWQLQVGATTASTDQVIEVTGNADAALLLTADNDNATTEDDNPYIRLRQDGGSTAGIIGLTGTADKAPNDLSAYTGVVANALLLGTASASDLQLGTNNNVRLTVLSGGNVGIADTTPAYALTVGNGDLSGIDSSGNLIIKGSGAAATADFSFGESASARTINALTRTSNAAGTGITITAGAAGSGASAFSGGALALNGGAAAGTGNANGGNVTLDGGAAVGTGTTGYVILQGTAGNVGIGNLSPTNKLSVTGSADFSGHLAVGGTATVDQNVITATNGSVTATEVLNIRETSTNTTATRIRGVNVDLTYNPGSASSSELTGLGVYARTASGNAQNITNTIFGLQGFAVHNGSGTINAAVGMGGSVYNNDGGTITAATGLSGTLFNSATGTIGTAYGIYGQTNNTAGGTITTAYGLYTATPSGTFGNYYAAAFMGGNVGIRTSTPSQALEVAGNIAFSMGADRTFAVNAQSTNVAGNALTISAGAAGSGASAFSGGALTLQGGAAAGTGNANGGNVILTGGTGVGTGARGLVVIDTPAYTTVTNTTCSANCTIGQSNVDNNAAIIVNTNTSSGLIVTMPDPTVTTAGRVIYVTAADNTLDFTLRLNAGGTLVDISMRENSTATLIWNGSDWTAAGASSSTTLQSAYDSTLTSAGGAELVLNAPGGNADGLTIRNNGTTPIVGGILEVQSSIGSNLLSVNNNATEYAVNGGAETSTNFSTNWTNTTGGTVTRDTSTYATGQASVSVVTTTTNHGAKNVLSAALTSGMTYSVSFAAKAPTNFATLQILYSPDGTTTGTTQCATAQTVTSANWSRILCTFIASGSINSSNAILIRQTDSTGRTFYIDNLSVTVNANMTFAADGSVSSSLGTNWTAYDADGGAATTTPSSQSTTVYDGQYAVADVVTGANEGVRNNMAVAPATSTQYLVSFYAKTSTGTATLAAGFLPAGGSGLPATAQQCTDYNTQSATTTSWQKITCIVTTPSSGISDPDLVIYQTDATSRTFYIDALTINLNNNNSNNVQVGGANKGGPTTLLTLDRASIAPIAANNDAYLGSMYYDTTTGRIQCYEADGWGACGSSPDNIITLTPEYTGAVLNGSGIGTMTSDFCATENSPVTNVLIVGTLCAENEARNFYRWTTPQTSAQTYSIYVTYKLPTTFKAFSDANTIKLTALTDSLTNASATLQVFRKPVSGNISQCGGTQTINTSINTWQQTPFDAGDETNCSFAGGDNIVFKITMSSQSNGNIYVENLDFTYTNN